MHQQNEGKELIQIRPPENNHNSILMRPCSRAELTAGSHWFHLGFFFLAWNPNAMKIFNLAPYNWPTINTQLSLCPSTKFGLESSSVWGMIRDNESDDILTKPLGYQLVDWQFNSQHCYLDTVGASSKSPTCLCSEHNTMQWSCALG